MKARWLMLQAVVVVVHLAGSVGLVALWAYPLGTLVLSSGMPLERSVLLVVLGAVASLVAWVGLVIAITDRFIRRAWWWLGS